MSAETMEFRLKKLKDVSIAEMRKAVNKQADAIRKHILPHVFRGNIPQRELTDWWGSPYAHESGRTGPSFPYGDPGVINTQTGETLASFQVHVKNTPTMIKITVENHSAHWRLLLSGEGKMMVRPADDLIRKLANEEWEINLAKLRSAVRRV